MTIEQARAKRWSPEARAKQAAKIHNWQPWQQSTGAKTEQGKITSSLNACKGYHRAIYRNERRIMSHGLRALRALNHYQDNEPQLIEYYSKLSEKNGWRFFVMYGQTEATARISYVPPEKLSRKIGSIGIAIPNGKLSLQDGELLYEGPNVMMGYAENRSDLSKGDDLCGRLATGDLATVDEDGYFYLQGRIARFIKIHGNRINLDDVEYHLENSLNHAVAVTGEDGLLRVYVTPNIEIETVKKNIIELFALHSSTYKIHTIKTIPVTTSGKKDYGQLT